MFRKEEMLFTYTMKLREVELQSGFRGIYEKQLQKTAPSLPLYECALLLSWYQCLQNCMAKISVLCP